MTILVAIFVFIVWTTYRLAFPESPMLDALFLKPLIWLTPVLLAVKGKYKNLGISQKNILKNLLIGLLVGLVLSLERVIFGRPTFHFSFSLIITALFTAITEELFFRGYLLNNWLKRFKNPIVPMLLNGTFFTLTHVPLAIFQLHYQGYNLFSYLITNFVTGFVDIFLFYYTGSVITSTANHFVWNTFAGLFR